MSATCYLAAFDISDDKERRRLVKVLEGFGLRVQKSVFECRLTRSGLGWLRREIEKLALESGFCSVYKVGPRFNRKDIGQAPSDTQGDEDHVFLL